MTALWESQLESISIQAINYQTFLNGVEQNLEQLICDVKNINLTGLPVQATKKKVYRKYKTKQ
jgi:DNA topoisomerase IA